MLVDSKDASCGHGDMTTVCKILFFFFLNKFIYLFLAVLGLCFMQAFSGCGRQGHSLAVVLGVSYCRARAPLGCVGSRVLGLQQLQRVDSAVAVCGLWSTGSTIVAHGLSCFSACGISPDQGSNLCLLHWQEDCLLVSHQGSPINSYYIRNPFVCPRYPY